jgi:hypothetical protein
MTGRPHAMASAITRPNGSPTQMHHDVSGAQCGHIVSPSREPTDGPGHVGEGNLAQFAHRELAAGRFCRSVR